MVDIQKVVMEVETEPMNGPGSMASDSPSLTEAPSLLNVKLASNRDQY